MSKSVKKIQSFVPTSLAQQAETLAAKGKYADAIDLYKQLLEHNDQAEWRERLAACYLKRAHTLAAKGMFKEAVVIWEQHCQYATPPFASYDGYLSWLIFSKATARAEAAIAQLTARQLDQEFSDFAVLLGFLLVNQTLPDSLSLPEDSVFAAHWALMRSALHAYRQNQIATLHDTLKQLPYRSAFRDGKTLLKAVLALPESPEECANLLDKIPRKSPYIGAAELLRACLQQGRSLYAALQTLDPPQRRVVTETLGLEKKTQHLLDTLYSLHGPMTDKIKFNLALQYRQLWGDDAARQYCLGLLVTYPAGQRDFRKVFGEADAFEMSRLKALHYDNERNADQAEQAWRTCIEILKTQQASDHQLKIALIYRRMAEKTPYPEEAVEFLTDSLSYDPDDRKSYLKIIAYQNKIRDTETDIEGADNALHNIWLQRALQRFPHDTEILALAIQTERSYAPDRAITYAKTLLAIDPLNMLAKELVFADYLDQARRALKAKKAAAFVQAIAEAETVSLGKAYSAQSQLLRGLWQFTRQDKAQGAAEILSALKKHASHPLTMHYHVVLETLLTGISAAAALRELPAIDANTFTASDLRRLLQLIEFYRRIPGLEDSLKKALDKIKAPLKAAIVFIHDEAALLDFCEILDKIGHFELLRHVVKGAVEHWRGPIWVYYQIYARCNGDAARCRYRDYLSLSLNFQEAREQNDTQAMVRIGRFIDQYKTRHTESFDGLLDLLFGRDDEKEYEEDLDILDHLFGHLPSRTVQQIAAQVNNMANTPERPFKEIGKLFPGKSQIVMNLLQNHDLFMALLFYKAAQDLRIDTGVTLREILRTFDIDPRSLGV